MQPPDSLIKRGINTLPTIGDGRQSGTSDSPSILNAAPESAAGGGLAWLRTGDTIRIDLGTGRCDMLVPTRRSNAANGRKASPTVPESQTPWQEIYRASVDQLDGGGVLEAALKYRGIASKTPRHNHYMRDHRRGGRHESAWTAPSRCRCLGANGRRRRTGDSSKI